jgi:hypothetical protein
MSRQTTQQPLVGHAVIKHKDGSTYVGHVVYDGRAFTGEMSLRVVIGGVFTYRAVKRRTLPLHVVREVFWDEDASYTNAA